MAIYARPKRPKATPMAARRVVARTTPKRPKATAAKPAVTPPAIPGAPAAPPVTPPIVDYSNDPNLLKIRALSQANIAGAQAAETGLRSQAVEQYGYDPSQADLYGDPLVAGAAQANPNSTLNQLARVHAQRPPNVNESMNKAHLFYGTARGTELGNEATTYVGEQQDAASKLRGLLAGYATDTLNTTQTNEGNVTTAEQQAYQDALDWALKYPTITPDIRGEQSGGSIPGPHPTKLANKPKPAARVAKKTRRR
jgi:hypothetical protein